jgi:hypothetical protein
MKMSFFGSWVLMVYLLLSSRATTMSTANGSMCKKCKSQTRHPDDTLCAFCRVYRDVSNQMRTYNKSKALKESEEMKKLQAKRDAHTAFGRVEFNKNFWAQRKRTAVAAAARAEEIEAPARVNDGTSLPPARPLYLDLDSDCMCLSSYSIDKQ